MCKFVNNAKHSRIDKCMKNLIENINWLLGNSDWKIVACCCGHGKYPMTIIAESPHNLHLEMVSNIFIHRKRNFYKKDKQGYYYIPEVLKEKEDGKKE